MHENTNAYRGDLKRLRDMRAEMLTAAKLLRLSPDEIKNIVTRTAGPKGAAAILEMDLSDENINRMSRHHLTN
jgi:hypothetical protein